MPLVGQVETRNLEDREEQGYAQAFRQGGKGHDEHGGQQLPARNADQAGNILQNRAPGGGQLIRGKRGEAPLPMGSGRGIAAGGRHASNDSRGGPPCRLSTWERVWVWGAWGAAPTALSRQA